MQKIFCRSLRSLTLLFTLLILAVGTQTACSQQTTQNTERLITYCALKDNACMARFESVYREHHREPITDAELEYVYGSDPNDENTSPEAREIYLLQYTDTE